jgi:hypothetical protein
MRGLTRSTKPLGALMYLGLLLLEITWLLRSLVIATPTLSDVEERTKKYYYSSFPPANPSVVSDISCTPSFRTQPELQNRRHVLTFPRRTL